MYFYDLESGTFVGMSLTLQRGFETNLSLIEKPGTSVGLRFYCYLNPVQLLLWPVCDCFITRSGKKRWAIFIIGSEKKVPKDTFISAKLGTVLFTDFWSLASHKFTSRRPFKGPKWKTLLCRMSSCPKGLFLSLSRNTSHIQFILLPESPAGGKKRIWSLPLCYTCQLVMEILIATIKYFSKTCPQIHYHSCRSGSWERAINLEEGL